MSVGRPPKGLAAREILVLLVFGCRVVQTVMRMAIGALVIYICEDYACTETSKGWILSAHAFGYCTTQILGGQIADRIGGKAVITWAMAAAGLALAVTPIAARSFGLRGVTAAQVMMGVATGPLFPASIQLLAKWLPASERAFASTALDSGITLGSLLSVPVCGALVVRSGWQVALGLFGVLAVGYSALWALLACEDPARCRYCTDIERMFLKTSLPASKAKVEDLAHEGRLATPWQAISGAFHGVSFARLWAIYLAHFAFNFGVYFVNSWSAIYYLEVFHMRPEQASIFLSLPHAVNMCVIVFLSPIVGRALRHLGCSDLACRRIFTGAGFVVPAVCFQAIPRLTSAPAVAAGFCVAFGFFALHPCGFKANYMDVTTSRSGLVSGIGNTIASVASSIGPLVVAHTRAATGSWVPAFTCVSGLSSLAALIFCTLSSTTPIEVTQAVSRAKHD